MVQRVEVLASVRSHMPFLAVLSTCGVARDYGLEIKVDVAGFDGAPTRESRVDALLSGRYQFVSGLHHEPYHRRAQGDRRLSYVAQGGNLWDVRLVAVPGVSDLKQLEGKSVIISSAAPCVMGNFRRVLQDCGVDLSKVGIQPFQRFGDSANFGEVLRDYLGKRFDAALVGIPFDLVAQKRGFALVPLPERPIVHNVTVCVAAEYARRNEETVVAFLKSFAAAVHFFKTDRAATTRILKERVTPALGITEEDEVAHLYDVWKDLLSVKPYPLPQAIQNTFDLDAAKDPLAKGMNPLEMWDLHYLRAIDDSGFIDALYR